MILLVRAVSVEDSSCGKKILKVEIQGAEKISEKPK
jgi:hypothetical protein